MRALAVGGLLALLAVPVFGDEPTTEPAPAGEKPPPPTLFPRSIDIPRPGTALAPGADGEEVWVATDDGAVLRVAIDGGVTRGSAIGLAGIEALATWSEGDRLAVGTPTEMIVLEAESGEELWRAARPIAFAFDPSRRNLVSVSATGEVLERDATTGKQTGRRSVAEKRAVVRASLHTSPGFAVLGVADG